MGTTLRFLRRGRSHSSRAAISAFSLCASSSTTALLAAQVTSCSSASASMDSDISGGSIDRFPHDGVKLTERFEGFARKREEKTLYGDAAAAYETGSAEKARAAAATT